MAHPDRSASEEKDGHRVRVPATADVVYRVCHESGAADSFTGGWPVIPIPQVGEYISIYDIVHGWVFHVNREYAGGDTDANGDLSRIEICIACDGSYERYACECTGANVSVFRAAVGPDAPPEQRYWHYSRPE